MAAPIGNQYAVGNNGGRPVIYSDPEELRKNCEAYFEYIKGEQVIKTIKHKNEETGIDEEIKETHWIRHPEPPMITALSLFIGFNSKSTLHEYAKKEEFSNVIKRAITKVEMGYETRLSDDKPTGAIFALKNMGWSDRTINEIVGKDGEVFALTLDLK